MYTLSLFTKIPHAQVKHYHIKQNQNGYYLSERHMCANIPKLIEYHSLNAGGLACRLKCPPGRVQPATAGRDGTGNFAIGMVNPNSYLTIITHKPFYILGLG